MYEQYLISKNQVYLYGVLIAAVIGIFVYIFTVTKKKSQQVAISSSFKTFGVLAIALIVIGLQCRTSIYRINYDAMAYDKTIKYASIINLQRYDDSQAISSIQNFMTGNNPQSAKDSLRHKCELLTSMYLSLLDDMISYIDLSSNDSTFSIGGRTKSLYANYSISDREKELADSILLPIINETNNRQGEIYARLRIAKGFAEVDELDKMKSAIRENQNKIRQNYYSIFKQELK